MAKYVHGERLPLDISRDSKVSLPSQIVEQVRSLIVEGYLVAGDPLPSSRALAASLNVSRGTVVFAYEQLVGEGYLVSSRGGTTVADGLPQGPHQAAGSFPQVRTSYPPAGSPKSSKERGSGSSGTEVFDLRPGRPDISLLASSAWRAAWRSAAANPGGSYPAAGSLALRTELAEHLRLMRSTLRHPDDILVTAGAREGFRLLLTALRRKVRNRPLRIAVENPGYPSLRRIPQAFGHRILPVPVDSYGLDPTHLPVGNKRPDLVLVAPSHQYPLGASMPVSRRLELLAWAAEHDVLLVEDDYDSELRYRGDPLPALAALDRSPLLARQLAAGTQLEQGRVITLGSFSKLLAPGLNLGYMVIPGQLHRDLLELRADLGNPVPSLVQDAIANFLAAGGVRGHTARMRRVYRRRRELVTQHLGNLPGTSLMLMDGGLHAVLAFDSQQGYSEATVLQRAQQVGVRVLPLSSYWSQEASESKLSPKIPARAEGLVIGFAALNDQNLVRALEHLRLVVMQAPAEEAPL